MANPTTGLFQTLVAAANLASQHLTYPNSFAAIVYKDIRPVEMDPGKGVTTTLIIPTVTESDVENIQGGPLHITDYAYTTSTVTVDQKMSSTARITQWDQVRTPYDLMDLVLKPRTEAVLRKVNAYLADLADPGAFTTNTRVAGAGADVFQLVDVALARGTLAARGVPIEDPNDMFFVTGALTYHRTLAQTEFAQEATVGIRAAEAARQDAMYRRVMGANVLYDNHIALITSAGKQYGLLMHKAAISMRVVSLPKMDQNGALVYETLVQGIPMQYRIYADEVQQGTLVTVQCGFGAAKTREDWAIELETA